MIYIRPEGTQQLSTINFQLSTKFQFINRLSKTDKQIFNDHVFLIFRRISLPHYAVLPQNSLSAIPTTIGRVTMERSVDMTTVSTA